jgi:hypothetical protein
MADITMCYGIDCPRKKQCYRFTAIWEDQHQSVFSESPLDSITYECTKFWNNGVINEKIMVK